MKISILFSFIYVVLSAISLLSFDLTFPSTDNINWWSHNLIINKVLIPVITLAPLWIRLMQCLRRSVESGKRWPHMGEYIRRIKIFVSEFFVCE